MVTNPEKFHSLNSKRKILIVDDEFINRELLGNVLKQDYEVIYAENGVEALDRILEYKDVLSLVLLDLLMPKMDGIEVLKRKKEDPSIAAIPVIVLTSDHESEVECLKLGAVDFIYKP
ncbi:MAG: response regulator, partial [Erysipelotrichaceae bacterium]|nr:response regulator [Erysipelotrichaceae bacterium]